MNVKDIKIDDELKNLLPPLSSDELLGLEGDIKKHGVLDPVILWNGFVADGHNRISICRKLGIETVDTKELHKDSKAEVMEWIIDHQFARRNLTKSQMVRSFEKVRQKYVEEAAQNIGGRPRKDEKLTVNLPQVFDKKRNPTTSEKMAEKIGVSDKTYRNMRTIVNEGTQKQIERMDRGGRGNGVSAIANEIRDRKDGVPEGFRKCSKCGEIKPITEFGKGNARHCNSCIHGSDDKETKKCKNCKRIKPISEFYEGRGICKECFNSTKAYKDSAGNILAIDDSIRNISIDDVIGDIYDKNKEVVYTVFDLADEIRINSERFIDMLKTAFEIHSDVVVDKEGRSAVCDILDKTINKLKDIRGDIHEGIQERI